MSSAFLPAILTALGEDPSSAAEVRSTGDALLPLLPSPLPVGILAHDSVAAVSLLARPGAGEIRLDPATVATAYTSERHFRLDGALPSAWAPLSGFWPTADGWLRTHANYPHHRDRLLTALRLPAEAAPDHLAARLTETTAEEAEEAIVAANGIAAAVRTEAEAAAAPARAAVTGAPLLRRDRIGEGEPLPAIDGGPVPLAGVRVLDLTRVIAGPVATRTLALLGAEVLRLDSPDLPEAAFQHLDTGMGKRSALLHLSRDREAFERLLSDAHVIVLGYRPGALEGRGLSPAELVARRPGLVVARLSAWGTSGPWSGRRGFDSIVQAASGIAAVTFRDGKPGVLPAQALDHSAGYLLAAGILSALRAQRREGGSWLVETSLLRIATELLAADRPEPPAPEPLLPRTLHRRTLSGHLTYAAPALAFTGAPRDWRTVGDPWGSAAPRWASN